jgi:hypothetical protein
MGDQPCRKAAAYTGQYKHKKIADKHQFLEWNSNARSQYLSGQKYFILRPRGNCYRILQKLVTYIHEILVFFFLLIFLVVSEMLNRNINFPVPTVN